ncbi:hypothetical protein [Chitinivibrio alkaliphilus]|uniref:Uncharacterized protein n=1 Tax=Chitinivibrio alkaliphilus ACht1 TaxID=1313304 RepID=U7D763_9BACT|nr:hypothetical protein [Chitinivibrio alkaliphilus]ERP30927.1 hypothetical protein CALK_2241 [Chitinivibrio alkaliphilus ACht1]
MKAITLSLGKTDTQFHKRIEDIRTRPYCLLRSPAGIPENLSERTAHIQAHLDVLIFFAISTADFSRKNLHELFAAGIHGLIIDGISSPVLTLSTYAHTLFGTGALFVKSEKGDNETISQCRSQDLIPLSYSEGVIQPEEISRSRKLLRFARYFPPFQEGSLSLQQKISLRFLIESRNLRRRLMVQETADSFESSGL